MKLLKFQNILIILYHSICLGDIIRPSYGQELNYIHVVFEWKQKPDATHYQLELIELHSSSTFLLDSIKTNLFIDRSNVLWNKIYQWRVRALLNSNDYTQWSEPSVFITKESKLHFVNITNYQDSLIPVSYTHLTLPTKRIV